MVVRKGRGCPEDSGASSETARGETGAEDKVCGVVRGGLGALHALDLGVWSRGRWGGAGFVLRNSRACGRSKVHRGREAKGWAQGRAGGARRSRTPEGPVSRDLCREDEGAGAVGGGGGEAASRGARPRSSSTCRRRTALLPKGGGAARPQGQRRAGAGEELVAGSLMAPKKPP